MSRAIFTGALLIAYATTTYAQFGPHDYGGGGPNGGPYGPGGPGGPEQGGSPFPFGFAFFENRAHLVQAHAVLATVAWAFIFPLGAILIRMGAFRSATIVHAVLQFLGVAFFIGAVGCGATLASGFHLLGNAHPIIGLVLLALVVLQPVWGVVHHLVFKRTGKRSGWSYVHVWVGRVLVTLGVVNGGLGLRLARHTGFVAPSDGTIIGYAVAAGVVWLTYVACAVVGERRRKQARTDPPVDYERKPAMPAAASEESERYA